MSIRCWMAVLVAIAAQACALADDDAQTLQSKSEELFARRIEPLLQEKCVACHGQPDRDIEGGLSLTRRAALMSGGDSGEPIIVAGKAELSPLILAVERKDSHWSAMPPKDADQLNAKQIAWLREWIDSGAHWPDEQKLQAIRTASRERWNAEDGLQVASSGGLSKSWTERRYQAESLWAYMPLRRPATQQTGSRAIDELIYRQMPAGLRVSDPADARTWLRRASLDLTGLPPTPEELRTFEEAFDRNADYAIEQVIERLLASPHYGERMAQHWLDVVRYADSSGFANDYERGNAWRYRDYVVRAFNADRPYDRFVIEQIAGDELDPGNPELLIATGFLRMGPWELTGMEVAKIARQRFLDDVTGSVGEVFLAHTLQCARCHDHKFDPIPTRDYYSIQAVFAHTQLVERPAAFLKEENLANFDEVEYLRAAREDHLTRLAELDAKSMAAVDAWFEEKGLDSKRWQQAVETARTNMSGNGSANVPARRRAVFTAARAVLLKDGVPEDQFPPRFLGLTPQEIGLERISNKGIERLNWQLDRYEPFALSVYNGATPRVTSVNAPQRMPKSNDKSNGKNNSKNNRLREDMEGTCVLVGGDPFSPGEAVGPGVLSAVESLNPKLKKFLVDDDVVEGRRMALARWIVDPANPLTARTIVNRMWLWHFGQPLAGNPNNFGVTGKRPTHPELLEWLADELIASGWSIKHLHRLIMRTEAYRRSSHFSSGGKPIPAAELSDDDRERAYACYAVFKPRRLTAEELRDSVLMATGELNLQMGGIPNRPEIHREVALQPRQVMGTFAAAWVPNPLPSQRHRRSLYALKLRGLVDPAMEVFNAPGPDFSCERREVSNVTPQVFALFNGQATHDRALALAVRVTREYATDEEQLARCFKLLLHREPRPKEREACLQLWKNMARIESAKQDLPVDRPTHVRRDAVEENTGERFSYDEKLYGYEKFVPDVQPSDVDAHTRALAHVCLVLINSNELMYVY